MRSLVKENLVVSPFLVFFLINAYQVGVGVLGFQKNIAEKAGYDAWISIILSGLSVHLLVWMIYRILNSGNGDIVSIHHRLFGKWLGGLLSLCLILYFFIIVVRVLRTYIEVIQIWMFPQLSAWVFGAVLLILAYSFVSGGFRTVTGLCFLSVIYTVPLILTAFYPLQSAHFQNLLIMEHHSAVDFLSSAKEMAFSMALGTLLLFYPFIKRPESSQKWAHLGVQFTIIIYLIIAVLSFAYYSPEQLRHLPWATLTLWKTVNLPFLERFEYIGLTLWLFVILPILCLGLWCSSSGAKRLFAIRQSTTLIALIFIAFVINGLLEDRENIKRFNTVVSYISLYTLYLYIPFLFVCQMIINKAREKRWQKG